MTNGLKISVAFFGTLWQRTSNILLGKQSTIMCHEAVKFPIMYGILSIIRGLKSCPNEVWGRQAHAKLITAFKRHRIPESAVWRFQRLCNFMRKHETDFLGHITIFQS